MQLWNLLRNVSFLVAIAALFRQEGICALKLSVVVMEDFIVLIPTLMGLLPWGNP
jgi:hypothetical protein